MSPWSLPPAIREPLNVTDPMTAPSTTKIVVSSGAPPALVSRMKSSIAIRAAAPPPTALNSDTSCGIAVIFTVRAVYSPRPPPSAMPATMISQPTAFRLPVSVGVARRRTAVARIAAIMPPADTRLPLRAVAGEFIRIRPMTKQAAEPSQTRRTMVSMVAASTSGLRLVGRLRRGGSSLEHLEHPVGDHVAADDVHRRERDRDEAEDLADRIVRLDGDEHRADEDDPVDRVRPRHQRRVEGRRDLADDG